MDAQNGQVINGEDRSPVSNRLINGLVAARHWGSTPHPAETSMRTSYSGRLTFSRPVEQPGFESWYPHYMVLGKSYRNKSFAYLSILVSFSLPPILGDLSQSLSSLLPFPSQLPILIPLFEVELAGKKDRGISSH